MGVSLIDTLVDRILFGEFMRNASSPTNVLRTPCAVGWAPNRGGWRYMSMKYPHGFSIDRKAWDWTVTEWLVEMWEQFILNLHPSHPIWWRECVRMRFTNLFYTSRFSFPDGLLVQQQEPGIMKSGCLLTLVLNSVGQTILHSLAQLRLKRDPFENIPLSMGDDTIQRPFDYVESYASELSKMALIKEAELTHGYCEFIGFCFTADGFFPAYWKKHLYQLRYLDPSVMRETLTSYQMLWYLVPSMLTHIREICWKINPDWVLTDVVLQSNANR
uniref:RNA-directed RNA polymerase C-terminal domain-containing protein n=1 Tax=Riboviria sp. TaxID=2585031 RepID=A0A8K1U2A2_9VIRU|nr:MAG: hypothetical protein 1 [Riboviria sp.]